MKKRMITTVVIGTNISTITETFHESQEYETVIRNILDVAERTGGKFRRDSAQKMIDDSVVEGNTIYFTATGTAVTVN